MKILVTGVTGYIGGRLIPPLLMDGHEVRVLVRDPKRFEARSWAKDVEVFEGDIGNVEAVRAAAAGVDAAYYLVHGLCTGEAVPEADRRAALAFAEAARGIRQVIYLGGILPGESSRARRENRHARAEVGSILRSALPTTEIRVGPIIGSGSASFEMVRYITERQPIILAPWWIRNHIQPIAVRDVLRYLVAALGRDDALGVIDIGAEPLTFRQMMLDYARVRGLPRLVLPFPVRAPGLAAFWVGLVTPMPRCLAVPLVRGVADPVIGDTRRGRELFPEIEPVPYHRAVELALEKIRQHDVPTRWSDALGQNQTFHLEDKEGLVREVRSRVVDASPEALYKAFSSLGGDRGWLAWNWAWRLRGFMDKLAGGPGLRRGRRDPTELLPGDAVDFWRVEEADPPRLLRLRAEMKLPGRGWLQWETRPEGDRTRLIQAALFSPRGFSGWAYWYSSQPFHSYIFDRMVNRIATIACNGDGENSAHPDRARA
jgi:uncharacterized protein YbjT (DUF2867 family)